MSAIGSQTDVGHCATALIEVAAERAFDFLADPIALGTWSLGCMQVQPAKQEGLYTGFSLYDGAQVWFNLQAHRELMLIDYRVGEPTDLKPRIMVRVVPASCCDLSAAQCYVSLIAWRPAQMTQDRWNRLCSAHEAEIWLIKAKLEGAAFASDRAI